MNSSHLTTQLLRDSCPQWCFLIVAPQLHKMYILNGWIGNRAQLWCARLGWQSLTKGCQAGQWLISPTLDALQEVSANKLKNSTKEILHCCRNITMRWILFVAKLWNSNGPPDTTERLRTIYVDTAQGIHDAHVEQPLLGCYGERKELCALGQKSK